MGHLSPAFDLAARSMRGVSVYLKGAGGRPLSREISRTLPLSPTHVRREAEFHSIRRKWAGLEGVNHRISACRRNRILAIVGASCVASSRP